MTAKNPADTVIKQAARAITAALGDAGLLADPADRDRCHVVGCVEHIDGMHVDQVGDAIVHVGCPACRPLADPTDRDEPTELDRFIGAISDPLYLQGYQNSYQNGYKHAEAERDHAREMAELAEKDRRTYRQDAIRAEAEVARLRDGAAELAESWRRETASEFAVAASDLDELVNDPEPKQALAMAVAELRATVDRVRALAERDQLRAHRAEADLAALRNRIGSIAGVLRCVDAPAASMIQDALDGGDPK